MVNKMNENNEDRLARILKREPLGSLIKHLKKVVVCWDHDPQTNRFFPSKNDHHWLYKAGWTPEEYKLEIIRVFGNARY